MGWSQVGDDDECVAQALLAEQDKGWAFALHTWSRDHVTWLVTGWGAAFQGLWRWQQLVTVETCQQPNHRQEVTCSPDTTHVNMVCTTGCAQQDEHTAWDHPL